MKRHQGYTAGRDGAVCSNCGERVIEDAVLFESVEINDEGSARPNGKAFRGLVCMDCYDEI